MHFQMLRILICRRLFSMASFENSRLAAAPSNRLITNSSHKPGRDSTHPTAQETLRTP